MTLIALVPQADLPSGIPFRASDPMDSDIRNNRLSLPPVDHCSIEDDDVERQLDASDARKRQSAEKSAWSAEDWHSVTEIADVSGYHSSIVHLKLFFTTRTSS